MSFRVLRSLPSGLFVLKMGLDGQGLGTREARRLSHRRPTAHGWAMQRAAHARPKVARCTDFEIDKLSRPEDLVQYDSPISPCRRVKVDSMRISL